ncbi:hypothetical protein DFJ73DRAFT_938189 [Zopfochytrium polystomum]|nr:hypothetical protein DFJ73DRAFT_938189 [Zopfochytrium polystomum]
MLAAAAGRILSGAAAGRLFRGAVAAARVATSVPARDIHVYRAPTDDDRNRLSASLPLRSSQSFAADPTATGWKKPFKEGVAESQVMHVGNDHKYQSESISTSADVNVAKLYSSDGKVLKVWSGASKFKALFSAICFSHATQIDLDKVPADKVTDLTTPQAREKAFGKKQNDIDVSDRTVRRPDMIKDLALKDVGPELAQKVADHAHALSTRDSEVLVKDEIPAEACSLVPPFRSLHGGGSRLYRRSKSCKRPSPKDKSVKGAAAKSVKSAEKKAAKKVTDRAAKKSGKSLAKGKAAKNSGSKSAKVSTIKGVKQKSKQLASTGKKKAGAKGKLVDGKKVGGKKGAQSSPSRKKVTGNRPAAKTGWKPARKPATKSAPRSAKKPVARPVKKTAPKRPAALTPKRATASKKPPPAKSKKK